MCCEEKLHMEIEPLTQIIIANGRAMPLMSLIPTKFTMHCLEQLKNGVYSRITNISFGFLHNVAIGAGGGGGG